ncbi:hypothetical protein BDV34DRAFT_213118 [Aspergillus parasiticus]|uniref:Transferase family protein n=1 Tax=Aspergillus parasiticus TaxID=5067 RepID=A0A5N6DKA6_ASPPA|nr:hypothetical protein BDV34DRAFT_213118 [Aspergillus parasiticus]
MTNHTYVEQLTPLDLPMPRTYIRVLLIFETAIATPAVTQNLQRGLDCTPSPDDKGSIAASYTALSSHGMPMEAIPSEVWPVPSMIDDALSATGAPVFAASLFRFTDQGVGLCVCFHHNAVDATGIIKVFPSCTSKLFKVSIHRINVLKETLRSYMSNAPTTNVLLCALIWTTITRFLPHSMRRAMRSLSKICDCIPGSQSHSKINSHHIAEVYPLVNCMEEYRSLFVGYDSFGSRDLIITSWADLDWYEMDFGPMLGRPKFVRFPCMEADGVVVILPSQRDLSEEKLEIMVMLRRDDMESLENDSMWRNLISEDDN